MVMSLVDTMVQTDLGETKLQHFIVNTIIMIMPFFRWFAVIVYMVYLFLIGVVMLNLLIAQMADTYGSVQKEAQQSLMLNRAWIVARVEHNSFLAQVRALHSFLYTFMWSHLQDFRQRFFKSCEVVQNPSG